MHIKDFDPYDFSKKEIDGVTFYYINLPWSPCVHVRFLFSVGAFNDDLGKEGTAHFLEHMIGNGSPLVPDKKAMKEFSRLYMLNSRNALTSYNWTAYVCKCLPEHLVRVFSTMSDYVFNPFLRPEDVEHERKVITQEAWGRYKNDKFLKYVKECEDAVYHGHEKSRISSPLGWPDTVSVISQEDINKFHKTHYTKGNLSVFLVGAITPEDIDKLEGVLADAPNGPKSIKDEGVIGKPKYNRVEKTGEEIGDPKEQLDFSISRVLNNDSGDINHIISVSGDLLYDVLFERLRVENSLCYGVSVSRSLFKTFINVGLAVKTSKDKLEIVEKEIWNVINEILEDKWSDRFKILHRLSIDQIKSRERLSEDIISLSTNDFIRKGKIETLESLINNIQKVTYSDVKDFIKKAFDREFVFTEVILPKK